MHRNKNVSRSLFNPVHHFNNNGQSIWFTIESMINSPVHSVFGKIHFFQRHNSNGKYVIRYANYVLKFGKTTNDDRYEIRYSGCCLLVIESFSLHVINWKTLKLN